MLTIDTNVLVYAADGDSPLHGPCRQWLDHQRARPDAWFTTWPILYEFMRVTTHPRVMRRPWSAAAAWQFVAALLASPGLAILIPTQRHGDVAAEVIAELIRVWHIAATTGPCLAMIEIICSTSNRRHRFVVVLDYESAHPARACQPALPRWGPLQHPQ